jgi:hypothetical protein
MAIKYKDFEKREQLRKDYIDKAAEAAKTQANAYTDEQIRNIPAPPAPDIPTALPQKYEAFKVQLVQGNISEGEDPMWSEYHKPLWNGNIVLTTGTWDNSFVTDTIIDYPEVRKYSLLLTIGGVEKELKYVSSSTEYNTYACTENGIVVLNAAVQKMNVRNNYYNNTTTVYVYCPTGSALIGQSLTAARYGKKQYLYSLTNPAAILQQPSETENTRFLTMCQSIATKNAKLKLTLTDNVIEANYANISNELVTTDYVNGDVRARWIGVVADRVPNKAYGGTYIYEDMPTCIKGILEVEYTDEEATKECVYDKIQGESYTFKIGDFNHEESSAFDYYFNGAILIPFSNAQIQASFTYRPVSGTEKSVQVKSLVNNGQMLPYFDISELFGQAANTVMAIITSNTAVENVDMGGRPITTISLTSNVQNFTDANDEIMVGSILTLTPSSLPQTYKKKAVTLATSGWGVENTADWSNGHHYDVLTETGVTYWYLPFDVKVGDTVSILESNGTWKNFNIHENPATSAFTLLTRSKPDGGGGGSSNPRVMLDWSPTAEIGKRLRFFNNNSSASSYPYLYTQIQWTSVNPPKTYQYTDADVKVNSEVRFTLDEANGKLAGQFGLKKTIDKEAGKLTFTADTLPTSAISGTLEIGETSTEGAAFVDGIAFDGIKANEENTFTAKQTFQDVQINGNLTAKGTTTTVDVKNLDVEQQLITVAKGNTAALTSPAGLKAEKYDGTKDGALVFDASGMAMVGDVVLDANGNINEAQSDLQDLATRAKPSELTDGHLLKWDATNKKIVDGGTISSGGGVKGKQFTFTEENIVKLGNDVNFSMTTSQNYAVGSTSSHTAVAADNRGMLQFEVGKSYKLQYGASVEAPTTVYAVASSMTLSDGTTVAKAEFAVNGKTLVVVDRATATANITSEASLTYSLNGAVAYFSDFSTVAEYLPIHVFTIPKEYYVRIPFDETILSTDIVAIFTDKIAPARVYHATSYIELNYGVSSSVYYLSDSAGIQDYAKYLIGTDYYLAVVGSSTTGGAYVVSAKQENINEQSTTVLVSEWVSETGGTFKWTASGSASSSLIEYGVVWNSEVKLSFATETDKETFEAAGCKIVSGKAFATPLTITCTTKPTKPICFTYTVRNNAR